MKGSLYGRQTAKGSDRTEALKDVDFLNKNEKFRVGPVWRRKILDIIRKDALFFSQNDIIDYSLLVGVHKK